MAKPKEKDPAFLFYSKDWLEGTAELLPAEKGVYIDLLCHQHQKGDLPGDTARLARIAGLSHEEFMQIWPGISDKFEAHGNRLVNRKLSEVMTERSERGKKNTVIGTFASLLRTGNFTSAQHQFLKKSFRVDDFLTDSTIPVSDRLTEWIHKRLKSIEDEDGNENEDEDREIGGVGEREEPPRVSRVTTGSKPETMDFTQPDVEGDEIIFPIDTQPMRDLWAKWKRYRWEQYGQRYGMMGEQADLKRLERMTYPEIHSTILTAIANKWKNLYPEHSKNKANGTAGTNKKQQHSSTVAQYVTDHYAAKLSGGRT